MCGKSEQLETHDLGFAFEIRDLPGAAAEDRVELGFERWREAIAEADDRELSAFDRDIVAGGDGRTLLAALFGNSPFLTQCVVQEPALVHRLFNAGPDRVLIDVMNDIRDLRRAAVDRPALAAGLRRAKRRVALLTAVADIAGIWPLEMVTAALSDFADAALGCAAAHLLRQAHTAGTLTLADPDDAEHGSGLVILGMGKLGARELNYSSDIDLIVLYDHECITTDDADSLHRNMVRLTRDLARLIDERTSDGYVFRTDLRLRPDPASTPLAVSVLAAETYYESLGQNWERAAMIKARPVAGDDEAGTTFLHRLQPFIWRKNLDFAAIQDIHSIKRQINAHRGGDSIAVAGHNIKLGRGGIREVEFFVQTQQLIWGGRIPELRCTGTLDGLIALAQAGRIDASTAENMAASYRFLRRVEHRLQMIDDEQTQTLPRDDQDISHLAIFLGFADGAAFADEMLTHLRTVEGHYAALFEDSPSLGAPQAAGNLVFTGGESDPETLHTLGGLGFAHPDVVDAGIRAWHHGRYRAMRSARSREILTELVPTVLAALAATPAPDDAFVRFDRFLSQLPAGVQLFAMFHSNPQLLALVAEIMGAAPRLAEHLSRTPTVLDGVLTADFFGAPPSPEDLAADLERQLGTAPDTEATLDISRRWANDQIFQVGVQSLRRVIQPGAAAEALSNVADVALDRLHHHIGAEFASRHGRISGDGMAIVAMGKLGSREMTPASDLDLIFVYEASAETSDGDRPLTVGQYFARLSQRLINAVTAQTNEGRLYEVDMRLRPSGNAGPIASSIEAFVQYHEEAAWTWEHLALTRARVVSGPAGLARRIETVIRDTLTRRRDPVALLGDVAEMRARMDKEHHTDVIWEVKHLRGGLVDIDFIAQYLQLRHAHDHPQVLSANTRAALKAIRDVGLIDPGVADQLIEGLDLWQGLQGLLRLTIEGYLQKDPQADIPPALRDTLAAVGGCTDFAALEAKMRSTASVVHAHFRDLIEVPAAATTDGDASTTEFSATPT